MPNPNPPYVNLVELCDTQLLLQLGPVSGALQYEIYKLTQGYSGFQQIGTAPGTATGAIVSPYIPTSVQASYNLWGASVTTADGTSSIAYEINESGPNTLYWNYPIGETGGNVSVPLRFVGTQEGSTSGTWEISDPSGFWTPADPGGYSVTYDSNAATVTCSGRTFNGIGYSNSAQIDCFLNNYPSSGYFAGFQGFFLVVSAYTPCPNTGGCCGC